VVFHGKRSGVKTAAFPYAFDKIVTGDSRKSSIPRIILAHFEELERYGLGKGVA
jgi:hypothetical protein